MRRLFAASRVGLPSWASGSTLNQWITLPGDTRLTPIMPTQDAPVSNVMISSYSGMALHPETGDAYVAGGGHDDGQMNEVYKIALLSETPQWSQLCTRTPYSQIQHKYQDGVPGPAYYLDGRPASRHTWWSMHVVPERNRLMFFTAGAVWGTGNENYPTVDGFRLATNDYDPEGTFADAPFVQAGMLCERDAAGNVWISRSSGSADIAKWTQSTATWATVGTQQVYDRHGSFCYDSLRDRIVKLPETGVNGRHWPCSGAFSVTYFTMTGDITVSSSGTLVYEPVLDRYLLAPDSPGASVTLYSIHPTTWVATAYSTTGTAPITGGAGRGNMNRRICYHPQLGGLLVQPEADDYMHFLRTH